MIQEIEKSLIGALVLSQKKIIEVLETVTAEDFSCDAAKRAFIHIANLFQNRKSIDLVSISALDTSLVQYLAHATSNTFTPAVVDYAHQVATEAKKRRILSGIQSIQDSKRKNEELLSDILSLYQKEMTAGKKNPDVLAVMRRFDEKVKEHKKNGNMGFETGFKFLFDKYINYLPGHIWVIGGWTSTGKTAVMIQKIRRLIEVGKKPSIVIISTEMTEEQIISRMIANFSTIHSQRILYGKYRDATEEEAADTAKSIIAAMNIKIYDDIYTLDEIETALRKADLQGGVNISFIDYVQNIHIPGTGKKYEEQAEIARRLQKLAKDVRATIVCFSQVSNDVGRGNTEQLEMKGAGEWSAVADVGIMLKRHPDKDKKYRMKYEVKKNRHGALCDAVLEYKGDFTRLEEVEKIDVVTGNRQ